MFGGEPSSFRRALRAKLLQQSWTWSRRLSGNRRLASFLRRHYGTDVANDVGIHMAKHPPYCGLGAAKLRRLAEVVRHAAGACSGTGDADVSIIIPTYNALHLTLSCVARLLSHRSSFSFEVLVADDRSSDCTATLLNSFGRPIRVVTNPHRTGFVGNCNFAARFARGKFLVLLNNDTIVLPGWLDGLITPLREDRNIGLTGSRLIAANGKLQEAGSFVFSNGRTLRYGSKDDPGNHEYSRSRDTDFISGASIAISTELWRRLGGFDERFAPGYYEDVDLAFRVRTLGYRVVYCSQSSVIHIGKLSFGSSAQSIAATNRAKFVDKWHDEMQLRPQWPGKRNKQQANHIIALRELRRGA